MWYTRRGIGMPGWVRRAGGELGGTPDNETICRDSRGRLRLCDGGVDLRNLSENVRRSLIGGMAFYDYAAGRAVLGHEPSIVLGDYLEYRPTNYTPMPLRFISMQNFVWANAVTRLQYYMVYQNRGSEDADIIDMHAWGYYNRSAFPLRAYAGDDYQPLPSMESCIRVSGGGLAAYRVRVPGNSFVTVYLTDDPYLGGEQESPFSDLLEFRSVPRYRVVYGGGYLTYMRGRCSSPCGDYTGMLYRYTSRLAVEVPLQHSYDASGGGEVTMLYYLRRQNRSRIGASLWESGAGRGVGVALDDHHDTGGLYVVVEERSGVDPASHSDAARYTMPSYMYDEWLGVRVGGGRAQAMIPFYGSVYQPQPARISGTYGSIDSVYLYTMAQSTMTLIGCVGVAETRNSFNVHRVLDQRELAVDIELSAPIERVLFYSSDPSFRNTYQVWDNGAWRSANLGRPVELQNAPTRLFVRIPVSQTPFHYAVLVDTRGG